MLPAFAVLLWAATAVKVVQLLRAPDDRLLRTIAGGLAAGAIAFTVGRQPIKQWLEDLILGLPKLLSNLGMATAFYALLAFFVHSTIQPRSARRLMRRHTAIVGTLFAAAVLVWATMPTVARIDPGEAGHLGNLSGTAFQAIFTLALLYAILGALRYAPVYARNAARLQLRIGLRILVIGLAAAALVNLISVIVIMLNLVPGPNTVGVAAARQTYLMIMLFTIPCLAVGLAYPIVAGMVAAAPLWWRHWREYWALRPLWRQIHQAFPELTLRRPLGAVKPWGVHARRYRRACEIRDGLVMLGPYYPVHSGSAAPDATGTSTPEAASAAADGMTTHAARVRDALRARTEARSDGSEPIRTPMTGHVPHGPANTLAHDVRWLVSLSRSL